MYFDFSNDGLVCKECLNQNKFSMRLKKPSQKALEFIMNVSLNDLFKFNLDSAYTDEMSRMAKIYLKQKLDREYNKLDFLVNIH